MRRKAYLLLELLIAFSILALCAVPLVRNPMYSARAEVASFERMELERMAELAYAGIMEQLIRNEIPWKELLAEKLPKEPLMEETLLLELPGILKREYQKKIYLWNKGKKEGANGEDLRLIALKVLFEPKGKNKKNATAFTYRFFLSGNKKSKPSTQE